MAVQHVVGLRIETKTITKKGEVSPLVTVKWAPERYSNVTVTIRYARKEQKWVITFLPASATVVFNNKTYKQAVLNGQVPIKGIPIDLKEGDVIEHTYLLRYGRTLVQQRITVVGFRVENS